MAILALASCSGPAPVNAGSPAFYWAAARQTFAAGDYLKAADDLDHLIDNHNENTFLAIPWSLVLTSGLAAGYMDLADNYAAGARMNKDEAPAFHRKASEYRAAASRLSLRFAQNVDLMEQLPPGAVPLAFSLPKGSAAEPALLSQIAAGMELSAADAETAQALAIERDVLLAACRAAGAANDTAKAAEILGRVSPSVPRDVFAKALAEMLNNQSALYARDKLDDPKKVAIFRQRAQKITEAAQTMLLRVQAKAQ